MFRNFLMKHHLHWNYRSLVHINHQYSWPHFGIFFFWIFFFIFVCFSIDFCSIIFPSLSISFSFRYLRVVCCFKQNYFKFSFPFPYQITLLLSCWSSELFFVFFSLRRFFFTSGETKTRKTITTKIDCSRRR